MKFHGIQVSTSVDVQGDGHVPQAQMLCCIELAEAEHLVT